mmetsp:Transcript_121147/g.302347  ORF Transcript_121147/g.302347 Transcript_121147/m.302347 type:complete len:227 (-) Transcript_121147:27-707(-)
MAAAAAAAAAAAGGPKKVQSLCPQGPCHRVAASPIAGRQAQAGEGLRYSGLLVSRPVAISIVEELPLALAVRDPAARMRDRAGHHHRAVSHCQEGRLRSHLLEAGVHQMEGRRARGLLVRRSSRRGRGGCPRRSLEDPACPWGLEACHTSLRRKTALLRGRCHRQVARSPGGQPKGRWGPCLSALQWSARARVFVAVPPLIPHPLGASCLPSALVLASWRHNLLHP